MRFTDLRMAAVALAVGTVLGTSAFGQQPAPQQPRANDNWPDQRVNQLQREFPDAQIRITGRDRTVRRQAELMYDRAREDPEDLVQTYGNAPYTREMNQWLQDNPGATRQQAVRQFEQIVNQAMDDGARVSNHIRRPENPTRARDISIPQGDAEMQNRVEQRVNQLGGNVGREPNAPTGPHWHLSLRPDAPTPTPTPTPSATPTPRPVPVPAPTPTPPVTQTRTPGTNSPTAALKIPR